MIFQIDQSDCDHGLSLGNTDDTGRCLECGALLEWVVPVTIRWAGTPPIDYDAAIKAWHDLSYLQLKTVEDEIKYIVDAALGGAESAMVGGGY